MKTIAIVNQKGGIGKTTTAAAIGSGLVNQGAKVLFLDLDAQCNLSYLMQADDSGEGVTSFDLMQGTATAADAVQTTMQGNVIPGSPMLAAAEVLITGNGREHRLKEALEPIAGQYDYCIIDTPPALGTCVIAALTAADSCIIPAQADIFSLQGIAQLNRTIKRVKERSNPGLTVAGIVLTKYDQRTVLGREVSDQLQEIAELLHTRLFDARISDCEAIRKAQYARKPIYTYDPKSKAAADYEALIAEIQKGD